MKRRNFLYVVGAVASIIIIGGLWWYSIRNTTSEKAVLRLLTRAEEALEDFINPFREKYPNVDLRISIYKNQNEMINRLQAGYKADVITLCINRISILKDLKLIQPIDVNKLKYWNEIFKEFKNIPGVIIDDKVWFVPTNYDVKGIVYRTDIIERSINSWADLFNPEFTRHILFVNNPIYIISIVALILGYNLDFNKNGWWELTDNQLENIKDFLAKHKNIALKFSNKINFELPELMASGEVWLSIGSISDAIKLLKSGVPVKYVLPKEGPLILLYGNAITKETKHLDLAYALVDNYLAPHSQILFIKEYQRGITNKKVFEDLIRNYPDLIEKLIIYEPSRILKTGHLVYPVKNYSEWEMIWNEIFT